MQYIPKEIEGNVNVSKSHPLKEFSALLLGLVISIVTLYIILGFIVDIIIPLIPPKFEYKIAEYFTKKIDQKESVSLPAIQEIFNNLISEFPDTSFNFTLHIVENKIVNAVALPGGHILLFKGLIDEIESENELSFVLGHELGHFYNRDHLRGMGRGLILVLLSSLFSAQEYVMNLFSGSIMAAESKFSQKQEKAADRFGLELLNNVYGHTGGSLSFFTRLKEDNKIKKFQYFFSSHPNPEERIIALENIIKSASYHSEETKNLDLEATKDN